MQETASFWTDIKNLGDQLEQRPESFCFARLSEVYLKVGLVDDAINVARQGVLLHPRYLSGQRVLALACHAKGLNEEALDALQIVTEALPEDVAAQKLLGRLLIESGNKEGACHVFRTALEFAPGDVECQIELESLERSVGTGESSLEFDDDEEIIEDLEILEELDVFEEDQTEDESESEIEFETDSNSASASDSDSEMQDNKSDISPVVSTFHDPLSTGTLAELYVSQGFTNKALDIYRTILVENPGDLATVERVAELEALDAAKVVDDSENDNTFVEEPSESEFLTDEFASHNSELLDINESSTVSPLQIDDLTSNESGESFVDDLLQQSPVNLVPQQGSADNNALAQLDGWLENIRRIKSCR